ncbi:MAG TPA: hypothetical protein VFF06_30650 [Polyangia bacterium]|nr:hypothetical protein [Polyangia bacterium]
MTTTHSCESCGMSIDNGVYCQYCVGSDGKLQPFEERFERMVQWQQRKKPGASRAAVERETLEYLAKMPAWKDHPRVKSRG